MKKLGLVGGTGPESTLLYYRELNKRISERTEGKEFPELVIESLNLSKALDLVVKEQYEDLATYLTAAIKHLEASGADLVALTAATMHVVFEQVRANASVPMIAIPEAVADVAASFGYQKVGLLGTIFTMEKDYLKGAFIKKGIEVVIPSSEDRSLVHTRIVTELEHAVVKESTRAELIAVIEKMRTEAGIEAVILGCTDYNTIAGDIRFGVSCFFIYKMNTFSCKSSLLHGCFFWYSYSNEQHFRWQRLICGHEYAVPKNAKRGVKSDGSVSLGGVPVGIHGCRRGGHLREFRKKADEKGQKTGGNHCCRAGAGLAFRCDAELLRPLGQSCLWVCCGSAVGDGDGNHLCRARQSRRR